MEAVSLIIITGVILILYFIGLKEEGIVHLSLCLAMLVSMAQISVIFTHIASPLELQNGAYHFVEEFVPKKESGTVYIKVEQPWWWASYLYRVECAKMMGGCPESWPEKFEIVDDGEKFVIVPLKIKK